MKKSKEQPDMRVLKTAACKTLSGKSTLTYQVGVSPDSVVHLRITKNSGGGFFSDEWISHDAVQDALKKRREDQAITSFLLIPVFSGKSANNSSFLASILKHLKLIQPLKGKQREHELMDPRPFLDQVSKLMSAPVKTVRKASVRKTPAKKTVTKTVTKKTGGNATVKKASIKKAAIKRASAKKAAVKKKRSASAAKASSTD